MTRIEEHAPKQIIKILIGNKIDMKERKCVSTQTAEKWAKDNDFAMFKEISALDGTNLQGLVNEIGQQIFNHRRDILDE